jgi:hypothetical protein
MREVTINDINSLQSAFNSLPNSYIFRGHANSNWSLQPSLERILGDRWEDAKTFEDYALEGFRAKFHLYDHENIAPDSKLAWLAVMQHYGVPTRLLDFTESPYVALYFALEDYDFRTKNDLAVYALNYSHIMDSSIAHIRTQDSTFSETRETVNTKQDLVFDDVVDRFAYDILWVTEPRRHNLRLDRQGGCFLIAGNRTTRIEDALALERYRTCDCTKYVISASLYAPIFALLRKMNVTSKSLYGDLDGLARSIRMEMQVYCAG